MSILKELLLITVCVLYTCGQSNAKSVASGQCGSAFVKALYRACAIARRAFHPLDTRAGNQQEESIKVVERRSNGGRFGGSGGGGLFKKRLDSGESKFFANRAGFMREEIDEFPHVSNHYNPWSKVENAASLKAYLEHQREVDTDDTMQSYISEMEQRGTTSSNLLVDHCCKHGCDWQTFIDLCK